MFEIGIFCVIFLAVAYWAGPVADGTSRGCAGRRVRQSEPPAEETVRPLFPKHPVRSAPPERSVEAAPAQPPFRQERLESLLNAIKQDLNQLVQK
jgi:hypothetical protein